MRRNFAAGAHAWASPLPTRRALSPRPAARQRREEDAVRAMLPGSTR